MPDFSSLPFWLFAPLFILVLAAAVAIGYLGHRRLRPVASERGETSPGSASVLSAALVLLALLLGFSFSMAMDRYETRRSLVIQEGNALGTAWLRIQLLDAPERAEMSQLLRLYTEDRVAWSLAPSEAQLGENTADLQRRLWVGVGSALRGSSPPLLSRGVMDSLNECFDLASARTSARSAHVPDTVLGLLLVYAILSMVMLGAVQGAELRPDWMQTGLLLVLMTLAYVIVLDLDRPRSGSIRVSQEPLVAVLRGMDARGAQ